MIGWSPKLLKKKQRSELGTTQKQHWLATSQCLPFDSGPQGPVWLDETDWHRLVMGLLIQWLQARWWKAEFFILYLSFGEGPNQSVWTTALCTIRVCGYVENSRLWNTLNHLANHKNSTTWLLDMSIFFSFLLHMLNKGWREEHFVDS